MGLVLWFVRRFLALMLYFSRISRKNGDGRATVIDPPASAALLFPNIWTVPPSQRNSYQSSYCDFVLHSELKTWLCSYFDQHLLLVQSAYCGPGSSVGMANDYGLEGPGANPGGDEIFCPVQTGPGAHPDACKMDTRSFPGVQCGRGVLLTTHPLLVPRSWKSRAIPLRTLSATPGL